MGQNWGAIQGGPSFYDVGLDIAQGESGDSLAVFLSDLDPAAEWEILVYANVHEGQFQIGRLVTRAPSQGDPFARMVAGCHCPGARGWKISARSTNAAADYQAGVTLATSPFSSLGGVGVVAVKHGDQASANRTYRDAGPVGIGAPYQVGPAGCVAFTVEGTLDQANVNAADCWILIYDSPTGPTVADQPIWSQHVGQHSLTASPDGSRWCWDAGPYGRRIATGLWLAVSSTPDHYTAAPGYSTDVHAAYALT